MNLESLLPLLNAHPGDDFVEVAIVRGGMDWLEHHLACKPEARARGAAHVRKRAAEIRKAHRLLYPEPGDGPELYEFVPLLGL